MRKRNRNGIGTERVERSGTIWNVRIAIKGNHMNGRRSRDQMWKHVKNIWNGGFGNRGKHMEMVGK